MNLWLFVGEVEVDPERFRDFHLKHPEANQLMVDNLRMWSNTTKIPEHEKTLERLGSHSQGPSSVIPTE